VYGTDWQVKTHYYTSAKADYGPNSTCCVTSQHDTTTRYLAHAFWHRTNGREVMCRACQATRTSRLARQARHVFRGVATAWTRVDMSISLFPEAVPEIDANPERKRLNLTREHHCFFVVHHVGTNTATRTTSATRSLRRARHSVVTRRNK